MRRIRSSGANGLPLTIPIAASWPISSGSVLPAGSSWTSSFISSKKLKSLGGIVLNAFPLPSTNTVSGTSAGAAGGAPRPRAACAMLVPKPPARRGRSSVVRLIVSTVGAGSSSAMNERPSMNALVVRECPTW